MSFKMQGLGASSADTYDYSTATALNKDLYTVFSPTGVIPAGDVVPNAWLPGLTPTVKPAAAAAAPPKSRTGLYLAAVVGVGLVAWMLLGRRKNPPRGKRTKRMKRARRRVLGVPCRPLGRMPSICKKRRR